MSLVLFWRLIASLTDTTFVCVALVEVDHGSVGNARVGVVASFPQSAHQARIGRSLRVFQNVEGFEADARARVFTGGKDTFVSGTRPVGLTGAEAAHGQGTDVFVGGVEFSEERFVVGAVRYSLGLLGIPSILVHRVISFLSSNEGFIGLVSFLLARWQQ
jgi:hypothetical protein